MDNTLCIVSPQYTLYRTVSRADATMCSMATTLNERLRDARIRAGYETAGDFAKAMGIQEGTYRHHENGTGGRSVPLAAVKRYAAKLGADLNWLLNGDGHPPAESDASKRLEAIKARLTPTQMEAVADMLEKMFPPEK